MKDNIGTVLIIAVIVGVGIWLGSNGITGHFAAKYIGAPIAMVGIIIVVGVMSLFGKK